MVKKIFILCVFVFTIAAFGQNKEYRKTVKLFSDKKYQEVDAIADELLSEKYGKLSDEILYYTLNMSADSNNALNNYDKAIIKYRAIIEFINKGTVEIKDKNVYLSKISNQISELKIKIPYQTAEVSKTYSKSSNNEGTKINETSSNNLNSQDSNLDKTVTLTVTGTGKTLEEAKTNALRSAIEQAFGTFISSKTEILNDNLVKDEIVSISNGNIQKFDVISEIQIPDIGYVTTLNATISVTKLTSFVESKGVTIEFKGGLFSQNIKLQKLNEEAEAKAIDNLCRVSFDILDKSFDFNLKVDDPVLSGIKTDNYKVGFHVTLKSNDNYTNFINYFNSTLNGLSLSDEETADYKKLAKEIFYIVIDNKCYRLRNVKSSKYLMNFFMNSQIIANCFKITSNQGIVKFNYNEIYPFLSSRANPLSIPLLKGKASPRYNFDEEKMKIIDTKNPRIEYLSQAYTRLIDKEKFTADDLFKIDYWQNEDSKINHYYSISYSAVDYNAVILFYTPFKSVDMNFNSYFDFVDLEKISGFEIEKINIWDFIENEDKIAIKRNR